MAGIFDVSFLSSVLSSLSPILLAALGGMICTQVGVFNVSLEGFMLVGAFAAVAGSWFSGNAWVGVLAALVGGVLMSAILSYVSVTLGADAIVVGIALNLMAVGLTSFLVSPVFGAQGTFASPKLHGLPSLAGQSPLTYLALALVPVFVVFLRRTVFGFRLKGVGENPAAAESLGVNTRRYQHAAVLTSGALCGLAGAQLSLSNVVLFSDNMTAGRGWIAVVAVMLGRAVPIGTFAAALLFAAANAAGIQLQARGIPSQFTTAGPYIVTLVALAVASVSDVARTNRRARGTPEPVTTAQAETAVNTDTLVTSKKGNNNA